MQIEEKIIQILEDNNQMHLIDVISSFSLEEKQNLLSQLQHFDKKILKEQAHCFSKNEKKFEQDNIKPFEEYVENTQKYVNEGKKILALSKLACVILAGGQASRLRAFGPKGKIETSLILKKSLFQIFCEKILAAQKKYHALFPLIIMTSPLNHDETVQFFQESNFFGLQKEQVYFFSQEILPFLDSNKKWFLEKKGKIAAGPCGNGSFYNSFFCSKIYKELQDKKIEYLSIFPVDNPLIDPFDENMLGYHFCDSNEVTIKAIKKRKDQKKMGVFVKDKDKVTILEYFDVPESLLNAQKEDGSLLYPLANTGFFIANMSFIKKIALDKLLPLHPVWKTIVGLQKEAWKCEKFIIDAFIYANKVGVEVSDQEECYAPIKNAKGADSLATVQKQLLYRDQKVFQKITKKTPPKQVFELSQDFYYPTREFIEKCQKDGWEKYVYFSSKK